jgi:hypothetical protein
MSTRKLLTAVATLAISLGALSGTASAQTPLQRWEKQVVPAMQRAAGNTKSCSNNITSLDQLSSCGAAISAGAAFGLAHPPPGPDRRGWQHAMIDMEALGDDLSTFNVGAISGDIKAFETALVNLPQPIPGMQL